MIQDFTQMKISYNKNKNSYRV